MMWILWMGTKENPKLQWKQCRDEAHADHLIERLRGVFNDVIFAKEEIKDETNDIIQIPGSDVQRKRHL